MNSTSDKKESLNEAVKWEIVSEELIPKGALVLAAVSGGQDSMAMLSVLHRVSHELRFRLAVGHFDHKLRDTGERDRNVVSEFARRLAVSCYTGEGDVREAATSSGDTIEEAARKARYHFLSQVADKIGAVRIATAHTKDDQVETVLMRVIRGTGIRGLGGMPIRRGRIIRPLLGVGREQTKAYCEKEHLPYVEDPTNADKRFMRNRIRLELRPLLEGSYHSGVEDNLLRLARNAQDVMKTIRTRTAPLTKRNLKHPSSNEWVLNVSEIARLDETSLYVLFGDLFADPLGCDMDFTRLHYEQLGRLIKDPRGSGKRLTLPGLVVKREFENLVISKPAASASVECGIHYKATLTLPGETRLPGVVVTTEILEKLAIKDAPPRPVGDEALIALDHLTLPLVLRSPSAGDRMKPFGMNGTKKLSDIFIDKKVPGSKRSNALIVADANEILWLVGVATSEACRIGGDTSKVLKIKVQREI